MPTEMTMLHEQSTLSQANREDVDLATRKLRRLIAIFIGLIDVCVKVTGKADRALASIVGYVNDDALAEALEIRS
jgi:hypothetical protein